MIFDLNENCIILEGKSDLSKEDKKKIKLSKKNDKKKIKDTEIELKNIGKEISESIKDEYMKYYKSNELSYREIASRLEKILLEYLRKHSIHIFNYSNLTHVTGDYGNYYYRWFGISRNDGIYVFAASYYCAGIRITIMKSLSILFDSVNIDKNLLYDIINLLFNNDHIFWRSYKVNTDSIEIGYINGMNKYKSAIEQILNKYDGYILNLKNKSTLIIEKES